MPDSVAQHVHSRAISWSRSSQLGVIFVSRLLFGNFMEAVVPCLKLWFCDKRQALAKVLNSHIPVLPHEHSCLTTVVGVCLCRQSALASKATA